MRKSLKTHRKLPIDIHASHGNATEESSSIKQVRVLSNFSNLETTIVTLIEELPLTSSPVSSLMKDILIAEELYVDEPPSESEAVFDWRDNRMAKKGIVPVGVEFDEDQEKQLMKKLEEINKKLNEARSLAGEVASLLGNIKMSAVVGDVHWK